MQSLQFTRSLKQIVRETGVAELVEMMRPWMAFGSAVIIGNKEQFSAKLLNSYAALVRLNTSDATNKVITALKLFEVFEPARLGSILGAIANFPNAQSIWANPQTFIMFANFFEQLKMLQHLEKTCSELLEIEKIGVVEPSDAVLELEIFDYEGKGVTPQRLGNFVTSIAELHVTLSLIQGVPTDQLRFRYFDSGSGILVGVLAAKDVIQSMSKVLAEWWDRIRFRPFDIFDKKMEAMSKGLTILETVHDAVEKGVIKPEEAENLKTRVLNEVDTLIRMGVTLPLGDEARIDQRQLLTAMRDTKLLGTGQPSEGNTDNSGTNS